jgi:hypothetical protein
VADEEKEKVLTVAPGHIAPGLPRAPPTNHRLGVFGPSGLVNHVVSMLDVIR